MVGRCSVGLLMPCVATRLQACIVAALDQQGFAPLVLRLPLSRPGGDTLLRVYTTVDRLLVTGLRSGRGGEPGGVASVWLPDTPQWPLALAQAVRQHGLDVLFVAGRLELAPEVLAALPFGGVVLDFLDFATGQAPDALTALVEGKPDWEPRFVWCRTGRPARTLFRSPSAVFPVSLWQTTAPACAKAASAVSRLVAELASGGPEAWERRCEDVAPQPTAAMPGNEAMAGMLPRLVGRQLRTAGRDFVSRPQWFMAFRRGGGDPFDLRGFTPLYPPPERGWADPFPVRHDGREYLFFEDIDMATGRGSIAVMSGRDDGSFASTRTVLSRPYHLSYPFVFEYDGAMFMVPESGAAGVVELFRASRFPYEWERAALLLKDVRAVDASLFPHDGLWWLTVNQRCPGGSSWDEMYLYFADNPFGPFAPHPGNPVVSDVRRARPAGRIIFRDGRLLRPAQDCSGHYGRALVFCEIEELSRTGYRERVVARHTADNLPGSDSLHTYNAVPGLETVDGRRFIARWRLPASWRRFSSILPF